jgi:subtilisin-like proprotein convertase family protein
MRRTIGPLLCVLVASLLFLPTNIIAGEPQGGPRNFDVRDDTAKESKVVKEKHLGRHGDKQKAKKEKVSQAMKHAGDRLAEDVPGVVISESARTGGPETVGVKRGKGRLAHGNDSRERVLRKFLQDNADLFGLERNEIAQLVKSADYSNPAGNLSWVTLQRKIKGKAVFRGELTAAFSASGDLVAMTGELPAGIDDGDAKDDPAVSAAEAIAAAAHSVGVEVAPSSLQLKEQDGTTYIFEGGPFAGETKAELQYFPLDVGAVELAWSIVLMVDENEAYYTVVGAEMPDVLYRKNIVDDQVQPVTYRVYDGDSPAPLSPSNAFPGSGIQGAGIPRSLFTLISEGPAFNNLGWITDGGNTTTGNNVDAGLDIVSPDGIDAAGRPAGSPFRVFDFTYNPPPLGADPPTNTDYRWGEVSHMFFWTNRYHDRLYELGFTEGARNFQQNNFGRGGTGNDRVLAQAQDFSGTDNANFLTPPDGSSGRMQMYVFTGPNPDRVSAIDQDILLHELTHGTSNRLHNNAAGLNNTMSGGMGEGWSDFYARALISGPDEDVNGIYSAGGYSTLLIDVGYTDNYYYGIRRFPYAVISNLGPNGKPHNPLTFADLDPTQINLTDGAYPRGPIGSSSAFAVHNIGEIWSSALLEVRARIITRLGWAAGNQRALQIVTDGMKLDPVNPTLLNGRDSILTADCAGFGGSDELDIWTGFAVRGMGFSATAVGSASSSVKEAFDVPNLLVGAPVISGGTCALNDGVADPGETITITVPVTNPFCGTTASGATVSLDGGPSVSLGSIAPGATVNAVFTYAVPLGTCGNLLQLDVTFASSLGAATRKLKIAVGTPVVAGPYATYSTGSIATALPDLAAVDIPIVVSGAGTVADINAKFRLNHTFDGDLVISLIAPDGTAAILSNSRGSTGDNFGSGANDCSGTPVTFDDGAATAIASGIAPFASAFRPDELLSIFNGHSMNGTWKLRVSDVGSLDVGTLFCAQLEISQQLYFCCGTPGVPNVIAAPPAVVIAESASPANSAPDPDETVTMNVPLRNIGTGATTNLVATLLPGGGVLAPSGPQTYGVLTPPMGAVSRPFTFVATGACGSNITATLQLQDGVTNLGTVTFTIQLGTTISTPHVVANPAPILVPGAGTGGTGGTGGIAAPYPSTIPVAGLTGAVTKVTATLTGFSHTFPGDVDILLAGPAGQRIVLMSDIGSGTDAVNVNLTFDDAAAPMGATVVSGTFRPTNSGTGDPFPVPAPPAPHGTLLSAFNGANPNGTWSLYVVDDAATDVGTFSGGWSLTITTAEPSCVNQPCTMMCPANVAVPSAPNQAGAVVTFPLPALTGNCGVVATAPASGSFFPLGPTLVTGTATRADASTTSCDFTVTVNDAQPPAISGLTVNPSVITSNNHKMVDVTVSYTSTDNSGNASVCSITVTSNEPVNDVGDGNTAPDWEIIDEHHIRLRAERSGNLNDRVYTITVTCVDGAGNATSASTSVVVPHNS